MPLGAEHIGFSESHFTQDKTNGYCQENIKAFTYLHSICIPVHASVPLPQTLNQNKL